MTTTDTSTLVEKVVGILDSHFRHTLRLDLDQDIPACADDLASLVRDAEQRVRAEFVQRAHQLAGDRDALGREVREVWLRWAREQPDPKPSWLLPYDELSEPDREVDRRIGEELAAIGRGDMDRIERDAEQRGAAGREEWAVRFQSEGLEVYSHFPAADEADARDRAAQGSSPLTLAWVVRRTVSDWEER